MIKLTSAPTARKVSPEECMKFLELNNFPGQRALHESKARRYAELLMQGRLRPVDIAFAICKDGRKYLMNGQHVCQGCVWAGKEMQAVLTHYRCETDRDAWELFGSFDVHASRTQGQIFGAARGMFTNPELRDVPLRVLGICGSALVALQNGKVSFTRAAKTADKITKPRLVEDNPKEVLWVASFADEAQHLQRVGCATAMIATYRKQPAKADEFWRKVETGLDFKSKTEPARKLREFLTQSSTRLPGQSRNHHEAIYATCISWWNSWVTGEVRKSVKLRAMSELPKPI